MDQKKKKELANQYVQTHRQMGVYQLKNKANGKIWLGSSMDLNGMNNRLQFQLNMNTHVNKALQEDWKRYGAEQFSFEIVEQIKPREEFVQSPDALEKYKEELACMEQLWFEELQPYGERGYNKRPVK
ncbi:GIY-YIG nuclease family protein [Paenibacillus doosanensis]|uniref:GIY-YIG nuclease family protein n=1 Tax=Paenibacillus doosanensis TaxID=1229154 RepID=UPI00217F5899|nr:GIY-YIG nuclease family protein [Paenibacillus doosanensis]MCS7462314.1 GIY-YIG nuclease family protein [Paenibacillus doosanensis]